MALNIRKVSKDALPKSNQPGRTRKPSEFDDLMQGYYEEWQADHDAWNEITFNGQEEFDYLVGELNRAAIFGGFGKSIRGGLDDDGNVISTNDDGETVFYFQVRDKLKTGKKGPRGPRKNKATGEAMLDADGNPIELDSDDDDDSPDSLEDSTESNTDTVDENLAAIEVSIEDAKSGKRGRRSSTDSVKTGW